ncbi:MAG TPA: twin-arginine translocase subunit TatC, partial [Gemmatimonadales bacterium]|nr:twin-arginine translocase subunit TatC [Gemmatimonadales bacterium]
MTGTSGEMPFLDHLEELRSRILRSLAAVVLGCALGLWLVQRFQLVSLLKAPIAPYLTGGKLVVTSPTEPVMIVFKLGLFVGLVLAYLFVVPQALRVLFSFQTEAIAPFITYDAYFGFVLQVTLALGLSFELP